METIDNHNYKGGLGIPDGSTFRTVSDPESITGEAMVVTTPQGAVFHVRLLRSDDDPPPGGDQTFTLAQMCTDLELDLPEGER